MFRCVDLTSTNPSTKKCVPKLGQPWVDTHPELTIFFVCDWTPAIPGFSSAQDPQWFLLIGPWIWSQDDIQRLEFGYYTSIHHSKRKVWRDSFLFYTGLNVQSILAGIEIILSKHVCPLLHVMILWGYFKLPNSGYCMDGISACWEGRHFLFYWQVSVPATERDIQKIGFVKRLHCMNQWLGVV